MTYTEGTKYKLQADYYESIILQCTYVEDNTVWFKVLTTDNSEHTYKLTKKTNKVYYWNNLYMSWDNIENTLSEHTADDIWSKRTVNGSGIGQD